MPTIPRLSIYGILFTLSLSGVFYGMEVDYARELTRNGYDLSEDSLSAILNNNPIPATVFPPDPYSVYCAINYIEENRVMNLLPEVKAYLLMLDDYVSSMGEVESKKWNSAMAITNTYRMACIGCIFALDDSLSEESLQNYLQRIRLSIYNKSWKTLQTDAYFALIKAMKYKGVNVKNDLIRICQEGRYRYQSPFSTLMKNYAAELSEDELRELIRYYKNDSIALENVKQISRDAGRDIGYLIDEAGPGDNSALKKRLEENNPLDTELVIRQIQKMNDAALLPDVKTLLSRLNQEITDAPAERKPMLIQLNAGRQLACVECIFALDSNLTSEQQEEYLTIVRSLLYQPQRDSSQTKAFTCLLNLNRNHGVNIMADLLQFGKSSQLMNRAPQRLLFQYYGAELTDAEVLELNAAWADDQPMLDYLISLNQQRQME